MWFDDDDDDDDDEDQRTRQRQALDKKATTIKNDDEQDPLDAYMKTLEDKSSSRIHNNNTSKASASASEGRLDVECDDEATSHWLSSTNTNNINDNIKSTNEISTFQKASDQEGVSETTRDHRDVEIQLQLVNHNEIEYRQFEKCFLQVSHTNNTRKTSEGLKWQKENQVTCRPPLDPIYDFAELRDILPKEVLTWNVIKNLAQPTLVQSQTLGVVLCGKDAIVTAPTGSGKTLSYLWPISSHLMNNYYNSRNISSRALVLVPTRELALQIEQIAKSMFAKLPLMVLSIIGGTGRFRLSQKLQSTKPHLCIATPGRLLDVLNAQQKTKQEWLLPNITFLVIDEADKMIQLGFAHQVTQVLKNLRPDRQSLLVSATFDSRVQRRCQEWMHDPYRISIGKTGESSKHVIQHTICLPNEEAKIDFLKESLPAFVSVGRTLVFCATRQGVEDVATDLRTILPVETLHGDRPLDDRKASLKAFTNGEINVMIATDVAGRGLDINNISTVINFDPAKNWNTHVHRIGRAGRLSAENDQQKGSAYTLLLPSNVGFAKAMIQAYEREKRSIPPDVQKLANQANRNRVSSKGYGYSVGLGDGNIYHPQQSTNNQYKTPNKRCRWS